MFHKYLKIKADFKVADLMIMIQKIIDEGITFNILKLCQY